jgi:hypothetical protein
MLETDVTVKSFDLAWTIRTDEKDSATRFVQGNGGDQFAARRSQMKLTISHCTLVHSACAIMALSAVAATAHADSGMGACSVTSKAARLACNSEKLDEYWIAIGNCANLDEVAEVMECKREARGEWGDGRDDCMEQFEAREGVCDALGQAPYVPDFSPDRFPDPLTIDNEYLPLMPGTVRTYRNEEAGETVVVTVTDESLEISGISCRVVSDVVTDDDGRLIEETDDFYAQDDEGNVWYCGEIARNFEDGLLVDLEGSWRAGVDDAKAGIVMNAHPMVGDVYRQEFLLGDAEDIARVISITGSATVPGASCAGDCLVTEELTPIEPDALENKYYARGIGNIRTVDMVTGEEEVLVPDTP